MPTIVNQFGNATVEFECASCHHYAVALVESVGTGNLSSVQGEEAGYRDADQDFYANAYRAVDCVACPSCGYLNHGHLRSLKIRAALYGFVPLLILMLITWIWMGSDTSSASLAAMGIVGGGLAVVGVLPAYLYLRSRWWANASDRVQFQ